MKYRILIFLITSIIFLSCDNRSMSEYAAEENPKEYKEFLSKEKAGIESFMKKLSAMQTIVEKDTLNTPQTLKLNKQLIIKGEGQNAVVFELFLLQKPKDSLRTDQFYNFAHNDVYNAMKDMLTGTYDPVQRYINTDLPAIKSLSAVEYVIITNQKSYDYPYVMADKFERGSFRGYGHVFDLKTSQRIAIVPFSGESSAAISYDDDHSAGKMLDEDIRKNVYFNFCDSLGIKR
ncbi:MAG TPA: hypothetical protein VJI69_06580 [Bacteroidia bacterium]|nr:hypothetical protein [Bacteroidia bacterium]